MIDCANYCIKYFIFFSNYVTTTDKTRHKLCPCIGTQHVWLSKIAGSKELPLAY